MVFSKCDKQPGPDGIIAELWKWLDAENKMYVLLLINSWWTQKSAPEDLFLARVAPIFKKGDTDVASNYRPISLLNSMYKLYMILIRSRMQEPIEQHLTKTQYGFRPNRSTSHAIYIIRRIQDYAESKAAKLSIALLDWEKAFDKIQHDKLLLALHRLGFSQHFIDVIQNCYRKPTFYVKDDFGTSEIKQQRSGIRQGCPLSPFLFTLVMTCIDEDIQSSITGHVSNHRVPGLGFDMVYYANDTILFSQSNRGLNELLSLTERVSQQYGLSLNRAKCIAIPMNNDGNIHFQDGTPLTREFEATYLGNEINREVNIRHEIFNKLQEVRRTWFKLYPYWKATNASKRWKLIVYDAIIRSKLLYGLETIHLTTAMAKKLNAFQMRGIRKILNKAPTFIDRANTNRKLLEEASAIAFPSPGDNRKIILFSQFHDARRVKLLGHILRSSNDDPLRQVSFLPSSAYRINYGKKRVGKPRQNWIYHAKKFAYEETLSHLNYEETPAHDNIIYAASMLRQF